MNPDQPSREQIETRLTALLLGELPADEAALLRYTLARDPELQKLHDQLQATLALVREVAKTPAGAPVEKAEPLTLAAGRRQQLLAHFQTPRLRPEPLFWLKPIKLPHVSTLVATAFIIFFVLGVVAISLPNFVKARATSQSNAIINNLRQIDAAKQEWALEKHKSENDEPKPNDLTPYLRNGVLQPVAGETYALGKVSDPVVADTKEHEYRSDGQTCPPVISDGSAVTGPLSGSKREAKSSPANSLVLEAKKHYEMGEFAEAEKILRQAKTVNPNDPAATDYQNLIQRENEVAKTAHHPVTQSRMERVEKQWILPKMATAAPKHATASPSSVLSDEIVLPKTEPAPEVSALTPDKKAINAIPRNNHGAVVGTINAFAGTGSFRSAAGGHGGAGGNVSGASSISGLPQTQGQGYETAVSDISTGTVVQPAPASTPTAMPPPATLAFTGDNDEDKFATKPARPATPRLAETPAVGRLLQNRTPAGEPAPGGTALNEGGRNREQNVARFKLDRNAFDSGLAPTEQGTAVANSPESGNNKGIPEEQTAIESKLNNLPLVVNSVTAVCASPTFTLDTAAQPTKGGRSEELIQPGLIDFEGVEVSQVLDIYAKLTNRKLLRSTLPQGQIIFRDEFPITKSDAIQAVQSALALNGVSLINLGGNFTKVVPSGQAGTAGGKLDRTGSTNTPAADSYVTQVVHLQHVKPSEMMKVIQPFARLTNSILPSDNSGILAMRDSAENMERMLKVIKEVDVSVPDEYISEVIPIHHAKVDDIANTLNASNGQDFSLAGQKKIIANENGSSLLVYATREDMATIKGTIAKLDTKAQAAGKTDLPLRKPAPDTPVPQPEILTRGNAFSTFSLNVSDVSFKLAAASLQNGRLPNTASIRSEEFINAFDYRDPEAAAGQPMAFTAERARDPFAHNRDLLRFSIKTAAAGRADGRALNLVLLLDTSGSMERADRVAIIREALRVLAAQLQPRDIVSVVTFARTARLWADGIPGSQAGETLDQVGGITPEGGTNLEEAMRLAYETARRHYLAGGLNRVVLLTDGAANLGNVDPSALKAKVEAQRQQGIALDCFGIGWEDLNDDLLADLSSHGDGRYAFLNSPEDTAREFAAKLAGALQVAAADMKVQVEFNPGRVISYRQIGYAKHQLTKEQFRDNTVAAGEIAAQEAGNALYTVEINPGGDGPVATVHVRYRLPGTQDYRERSWDVAYDGAAPALDQAGPAMRLAAASAAFAEWLAASPFAQTVTPDDLLKTLSGVPEIYGADNRPQQLETMIREARSLEAK